MTSKLSDVTSLPERSLNQQVVLEEDEYTEALSRIIARDFFPSLVHLDATNEYLDALRSKDPHLIGASVRRLEQVSATPLESSRRLQAQTPSRTPLGYTAETPLHPRSEIGESRQKRARYDTSMSLDEFQARYTSEDNSSFTQILDEENKVRKEKYGWAWEAQRKVEAQRDRMIEQRKQALIEAPAVPGVRGAFTIEAPTPVGLITGGEEKEKDKEDDEGKSDDLTVSIIRKKDESEDVMAPQKDRRPAGVDSWNFKARNSLMFTPDADVSPYHPPATTAEISKNLKKVDYGHTRLQEQEHDVGHKPLSAPPSPTRSRVDAAIAGTSYAPSGSQLALVPNLPSPTPAELGPKAMEQLMTWGTLHATPRIINQTGDSVDPSAPFRISELSSREAIAHKLSNKAAKSLRVKAEMFTPKSGKAGTLLKGSMGPPSWTPRRSDAVGNLTPAARRLLERTAMGPAPSRRTDMERLPGGQAKERDLDRVRWTPTPSANRE